MNSRAHPDKAMIDKAIDWRKMNRPDDQSTIRLNITPEVLHNALRYPKPAGDIAKYPKTLLYRGYRLEATKDPHAPSRSSPGASMPRSDRRLTDP